MIAAAGPNTQGELAMARMFVAFCSITLSGWRREAQPHVGASPRRG